MTTVNEMFELVEKQKKIALHTPVYIFGNDASIAAMLDVTDKFSEIFQNPDAFKLVGTETDEIQKTIVKATNRTLMFYLFKSDKIYQEAWFEEALKPKLEEDAGLEYYSIDVCKSRFEELEKLKKLKITKYPCVLTYKAGHLIDMFAPEMAKGHSVAEQLAELRVAQQKKLDQSLQFSEDGTLYDAEKIAFEERLRKKEQEKLQREQEEKRLHLLEVKKKIEADKKARKKKYGNL